MNLVEIIYQCPICGHTNYDEAENVFADAFQPDADKTSVTTEIVCGGSCKTQFTIEVSASHGWRDIQLVGYPQDKTGICFKTHSFGEAYDSYDDFLENYVPDDAHDVYAISMGEAKLLEQGIKSPGVREKTLLKLIYLQYVMILEAYLSDRLINIIIDDPEKLIALVSQVDALNKQSHTLIEIIAEPSIVTKTVKSFLQRVSFHDLLKVSHFYDVVLGVNIFSDAQLPPKLRKKRAAQRKQNSGEAFELTPDEREMIEIIQKRHHLVHRNGRDDDRQFIEVEKADVEKVGQLVEAMVARVENAYQTYFVNRHYGETGKLKF